MYLKRIELIGFKSFADKTELELKPGVTAVVGPNGSGKSNIADAIRWVLGEQSAKSLRGAKMEDVIFAGSDGRRPVNYGEVTLVLDNADRHIDVDYSEVTVARRVYRAGDSEYYLNKQSCRLKDIVELLMDTGLGKEAYSIIGQGRIEEVLSTKPEDRRGIFEEAAGIVKYKSRRHESVKRLEETEANVLRVSDIVTELEQSLQPLTEQAEKAELFKEYRSRLEAQAVGLYVHDIDDLHRRWVADKEALVQAESEWAEMTARVSTLEAAWQRVHLEDEKAVKSIEEAQTFVVDAVETVEKAEARCEVLRERKAHLLANIQEVEQASTRSQTERESLLAAMEKQTKRQQEIQAEIALAQADLAARRNAADSAAQRDEQERELESLKADLIEYLNKAASKRNDVLHNESAIAALLRRSDRADADIATFEEKLENGRQTLAKWEFDLERMVRRTDELSTIRKQKAEALVDLERRERATEEQLQRGRTDFASNQSRLDLLLDMQHEYGGYSQGVRAVLQASGQTLRGICGAVAELVRVPAELEVAMETALGAALQHIVVESEQSGRDAIEFLKRRQAGRATMLPLNVMKGRSLAAAQRAKAAARAGFVGVASELVHADERFRSIVDYLLGQVIVAKTLKEAGEIARELHFQARIVTLEGDVVSPGGSMTGGSVQKKGTSLLGRTREIEQLTDRAKKHKQAIEQRTNELRVFERDKRERTNELSRIEQERKELESAVTEHTVQVQSLRAQQAALMERVAAAREEYLQLAEESESRAADVSAQRAEVEQSEKMIASIEQRILAGEQSLKNVAQAERGAAEEITEARVRLTALTEQLTSSQDQMKRLEEQLAIHHQSVVERLAEANIQEQKFQQTEFELAEAMSQLALLTEKRLAADQRVAQLRNARHALSEEIAQSSQTLREARDRQKSVESTHHALEVRAARLDVELKAMLANLADDYHIGYEFAKERYPIPTDIAFARHEVSRLRKAIQGLGDVHVGSIEELARGQERLSFLKGQLNDLIDAKEKLYGMIAEIDQETERRFLEAFTAIRTEFVAVFSQLFGGGHADLALSEPDKLLTTGIDIFAQPPGKKLQALSLLSGGERALTAIALLFAILRVRPVPFCVLDEVEAALDEANVARFSDYMREFSRSTQFLVITHRKGTMEGADVLYGVTMQESGVSRLMSMKLASTEVPA